MSFTRSTRSSSVVTITSSARPVTRDSTLIYASPSMLLLVSRKLGAWGLDRLTSRAGPRPSSRQPWQFGPSVPCPTPRRPLAAAVSRQPPPTCPQLLQVLCVVGRSHQVDGLHALQGRGSRMRRTPLGPSDHAASGACTARPLPSRPAPVCHPARLAGSAGPACKGAHSRCGTAGLPGMVGRGVFERDSRNALPAG